MSTVGIRLNWRRFAKRLGMSTVGLEEPQIRDALDRYRDQHPEITREQFFEALVDASSEPIEQ
jgi:hypothetical protein